LNDLEDQYCNRNCIGCGPSFLATAGFSCLNSCNRQPYSLLLLVSVASRVKYKESTRWWFDGTGSCSFSMDGCKSPTEEM